MSCPNLAYFSPVKHTFLKILAKNLVVRSEKFAKVFNFERCFSKSTFDQIRIYCTANY